MAKYPYLFGKYLRLHGSRIRKSFKKNQIIHPIPAKAYGRPPSAASQTGLYHDEDFNYYTKVSYSLHKTRVKLKPNVFRKLFESQQLNATVPVRISTSALHEMADKGGFDNYILNTSPEDLRSQLGERMRNVMYFYKNPINYQYKLLGLPWKVFYTKRSRVDPIHSYYIHLQGVEKSQKKDSDENYSPFYLPESGITPDHQEFVEPNITPLNLWWNNPKLMCTFRRRLREARIMDRAHVDASLLNAYRRGEGRGGGGRSGAIYKRRSKTYRYNDVRPY